MGRSQTSVHIEPYAGETPEPAATLAISGLLRIQWEDDLVIDADQPSALAVPAQSPPRNGVISASTSSGRCVTPMWVVPGSTASCAFGRSPNSSTMSDNGEKSRSPKISRVGVRSDRSSSVQPGVSCTILLFLAANSSKCAGSGATAV